MIELSMQDKLQGTVDDGANHLALLKLLERKGLIDQEDWDYYFEEQIKAKGHLMALAMGVVASAAINEGELDEDGAEELAIESGFESRFDLREKAIAALDYVFLTDEARSLVLEGLGVS